LKIQWLQAEVCLLFLKTIDKNSNVFKNFGQDLALWSGKQH